MSNTPYEPPTEREREQSIDEVIRDLISRYPGTIQRVDKAENMAMLRLHRGGSTWAVCVARAELADDR